MMGFLLERRQVWNMVRFTTRQMRHGWVRLRHFLMHNLLHADDPPHRLALGVAIGIFVTFTPTVGFQMVITVFLAWVLRANKAVGVPLVWISNPATLVPLYWSCYYLGRRLLGQESIGREWWSQLARPPEGWWEAVTFYWSRLMEIAAPLWLGGCIIGLALGILSYYLVYTAVCSYRMHRWGRLTPPPSPEAVAEMKQDAA